MEYNAIRLIIFVALFILIISLEQLWPRRTPAKRRPLRWARHFGLLALGSVLVRLCVPASLVIAAGWVEQNQWGLFALRPDDLAWLDALCFVTSVILLDFVIYWQHRFTHRFHLLWRLHRVHHADTNFDVSTALRFHPLEILFSFFIKLACIFIFGISSWAVATFEIMLNSSALFNHGNFYLPEFLDRRLRRFIVTPDMHRVHHSTHSDEHNCNFGFALSIWDRCFSSYNAHPRLGHVNMDIGLKKSDLQGRTDTVWAMLTIPVRSTNSQDK